jgi:uncharacterized protein (TIGR02588 family)
VSRRDTPLAEWLVALAGAAIALFVLGSLLYDALYGVHTPPELHVDVVSVASVGPTFRVEVRVRNSGGGTAAQVGVQGEVLQDGTVIDRATTTIDYVAGGSHADAALVFTIDPRRHTLAVRPLGYAAP